MQMKSSILRVASISVVLLAFGGCSREQGSNASATAPRKLEYVTAPEEIKFEIQPAGIPKRMKAGSVEMVKFQVVNTSDRAWAANGDRPVRFGYHWQDPVGTGNWVCVVWDDGARASLAADVAPGAKAAVELKVKALPKSTQDAVLWIAPLVEGHPKGWKNENPSLFRVDID